jgi:hypothetical protein
MVCILKWLQRLCLLMTVYAGLLRENVRTYSENGMWRWRFNHELYKVYNEPERAKVIETDSLRWLGYLCRTQEQDPWGKAT